MRWRSVAGRLPVMSLMGGALIAVALLVWLGWAATREWQRSSVLLVERRAEERAETLVRALSRDMQAVQTSMLETRQWHDVSVDSVNELTDLVATAFARYPYPESFFAWRRSDDEPHLFFNRAARRPHWVPASERPDLYPVVVLRNPAISAVLAKRIEQDIAERRDYALFDADLSGVPYQVVARILYGNHLRERAEGVFGFVVNLDWVRRTYFHEINAELARIGDMGVGLDITVLGETGSAVLGSATVPRPPSTARTFPLFFFQPDLVTPGRPADLANRIWSVHVGAGHDPTLLASTRAAGWTFLVIAAAALLLVIGLILTANAVRADAALTEMRSDFVAAVTHELKTPLATIRAVGDTLASGRVDGRDVLKEYSLVLVQEAKRLTRIVDNLLAYARVTDVTGVYAFEPHLVSDLVDEALQGFRHQLSEADFELHVDVPTDLPPVRADRTAIRLLLDNLVDNALRYSGGRRWLGVAARLTPAGVTIEIRDHGLGIPADELDHVQSKFYRGRRTHSQGNGLGLAIARRIAADHGSALVLESRVGEGTCVALTLPRIPEEPYALAG